MTDRSPAPYLSLLDSAAASLDYENGDLTFHFPRGIRISAFHPQNPIGISTFTGPADVIFRGACVSYIYLFRQRRFFRRYLSASREHLSLSELSALLDSHSTLEFTSEYLTPPLLLLSARLISPRSNLECQLELSCSSVDFVWEGIREDE